MSAGTCRILNVGSLNMMLFATQNISRCMSALSSSNLGNAAHDQKPRFLASRNPFVVARRLESNGIKDSAIFSYLSECGATEVMRSATVIVHDYSGLPWWATVVIVTAGLRTCITFPLAIYQVRRHVDFSRLHSHTKSQK